MTKTPATKTPVASTKWWHSGVRFECQGSGGCCISHGEYGNVFLTLEDRQRLARQLKIPTQVFTRRHCEKYKGVYRLKEDPSRGACMFLDGKKCTVYLGRPTQCRTWPFWPEVMNAKTWKSEVAAFCPGVGKGPLHSKEEILKTLAEQSASESKFGS